MRQQILLKPQFSLSYSEGNAHSLPEEALGPNEQVNHKAERLVPRAQHSSVGCAVLTPGDLVPS